MTHQPDTERLRAVFHELAGDTRPSPVPLRAIKKEGQQMRRRSRIRMGAGCVLLLAPMVTIPLYTFATRVPSDPPARRPADTVHAVRVVELGERVQAMPDVQLWLTKQGLHWSTPGLANQFQDVLNGSPDMSRPGGSVHTDVVGGRLFLSGIYRSTREAAAVRVVSDQGRTVTGTVVRLAGQPGWSVWYATSAAPGNRPLTKDQVYSTRYTITILDNQGRVIATLKV